MKKKLLALLMLLLVACLVSSCCLSHNWKSATCTSPKTCTKCGETEGSARGHNWSVSRATCTEDKKCTRCGTISERATGHNWSYATSTTPSICSKCNAMQALPLPATGDVFIGRGMSCRSNLTIKSSTTQACYIKLKDSNKNDVYSFFVRAGSTITAPVPAGKYYVYFAYGNDWYGPEYVFGSRTTYAKDDELCDFRNYSYTYELTPTVLGNFSTTPVDEDEF